MVKCNWTDVVIEYISAISGSQREARRRYKRKRGVQAAGSPGHQLGPIATAVRVSPAAG